MIPITLFQPLVNPKIISFFAFAIKSASIPLGFIYEAGISKSIIIL